MRPEQVVFLGIVVDVLLNRDELPTGNQFIPALVKVIPFDNGAFPDNRVAKAIWDFGRAPIGAVGDRVVKLRDGVTRNFAAFVLDVYKAVRGVVG